jgi:transposase
MRHELTDDEWAAIKPMLPNKPRGGLARLLVFALCAFAATATAYPDLTEGKAVGPLSNCRATP